MDWKIILGIFIITFFITFIIGELIILLHYLNTLSKEENVIRQAQNNYLKNQIKESLVFNGALLLTIITYVVIVISNLSGMAKDILSIIMPPISYFVIELLAEKIYGKKLIADDAEHTEINEIWKANHCVCHLIALFTLVAIGLIGYFHYGEGSVLELSIISISIFIGSYIPITSLFEYHHANIKEKFVKIGNDTVLPFKKANYKVAIVTFIMDSIIIIFTYGIIVDSRYEKMLIGITYGFLFGIIATGICNIVKQNKQKNTNA